MHTRNGRVMVPVYAARIEDLGLLVECHSCNNVGLLSARFLFGLARSPGALLAFALPLVFVFIVVFVFIAYLNLAADFARREQ